MKILLHFAPIDSADGQNFSVSLLLRAAHRVIHAIFTLLEMEEEEIEGHPRSRLVGGCVKILVDQVVSAWPAGAVSAVLRCLIEGAINSR